MNVVLVVVLVFLMESVTVLVMLSMNVVLVVVLAFLMESVIVLAV